MTDKTELIPLSNVNATSVFEGDATDLDGLIKQVQASARSFTPDLSTEEGRKEIASVAYNVARSKTAIDEAGKEYAAEIKARTKVIDQRRKYARDTLDILRDEVRKPLNDWEAADAERIQRHTDAIAEIRSTGNVAVEHFQSRDLKLLKNDFSRIEGTDPAEFEEFAENMEETRLAALAKVETAIAKREQHDAEQAELDQLRKEKQDRLEKEAAEREEKAQAEHDEKIRAETSEKAEREAKEREEKLEREKQEANERAEQAERDAAEAEERVKRDQEQREQAEAAEKAKRERNTRHKGEINCAAAEALVKRCKLSTEDARKVVTAIAKGQIPAVLISY